MILKNHSGFTFIELSIVLALFILLVSLIGINARFMNKIIARNEIDLLYATCINLQRLATASRIQQQISFDEKKNAYSYNSYQHTLPQSLQFQTLPDAKGPPSSPVHQLSSAITFTNKTINFYADGIIQSGTIYLLDTQTNSLYALSSGIAPISFLRKYRYDGTWHLME
jgi:prepilin-type N-terminal cleavage/methylation domain-containing protein